LDPLEFFLLCTAASICATAASICATSGQSNNTKFVVEIHSQLLKTTNGMRSTKATQARSLWKVKNQIMQHGCKVYHKMTSGNILET
jgi:hypothetical protein